MGRSVKKLLSQLEEITERIDVLAASRYQTRRDANAILYIDFEDGETIQLPVIPFRTYQTEAAVKLFVDGIKRHLYERPRRSGKEVESWNFILQGAVESPGLYLMVYPTNVRARAVLWDGAILMPDGSSLKFLKMLPRRLLQNINNQEMRIKLTNGSVIWVMGSDIDPDKLRGTNPRGIVYSEFAFQDPRVFYTMLPALRQNGGWLIGQSTFDGMNHFYQMIENNKNDPLWYCRVDSIINLVDENGKRYITDEMIEEDRRAGMPEYLIQQEYYGMVQINQETKYFAHAIREIYDSDRLIRDLILPNANVYSAFDLGINDCTGVTLFQIKKAGARTIPVVIGYIENNNMNLNYYVTEIRRFCARYNLTFKDHFLPHDGQKRDIYSGKNGIDFMREMGESAFIVPRPTSKINAIESMRQMLYQCEFNKENTTRLIDCLSNYSKEYDDKMGTYKNRPVHDWSSHGCFTGETQVLIRSGQCKIMDLPKTGEVLTSCGWKQYIHPRITRRNARLVKVVFKNGYTVKCTPDHLFKTESGWKSAELLQANTVIQSSLMKLRNILEMLKNTAAKDVDLIIDHVEELSNIEDVWCITVPGIQEFSLGNGAIVHNCDSFQTMTLALDSDMVVNVSYDVIYINQ